MTNVCTSALVLELAAANGILIFDKVHMVDFVATKCVDVDLIAEFGGEAEERGGGLVVCRAVYVY